MFRALPPSVGYWLRANWISQVGKHIVYAYEFYLRFHSHSRSIVGDYTSAITSQQPTTANHYQNRQMHENEFLSPSSSKIRGTNSELFQQQQHGGTLSTGDIRHQHQSDFGIAGAANDAGKRIFAISNFAHFSDLSIKSRF